MIFIADGDLERIKRAEELTDDPYSSNAKEVKDLLNEVLANISRLQQEHAVPEPRIVNPTGPSMEEVLAMRGIRNTYLTEGKGERE